MNRILRYTKLVFVVAAGCALIAMAAREVHWRWIQAPPSAETGTKPDGTPDLPVPTSGVNADGVTLATWLESGKTNADWIPVRQDTFSLAKGTFAVVYHTCYANKTGTLPTVARSFVGAFGGATVPLGDRRPPTSSNGCVRRTFFEKIPDYVPPGAYLYRVVIHFYQNERYPNVEVALPEVPLTIVP